MLLQDERQRLKDAGTLSTEIARTLYRKYYHLLFEFAADLKNSNVREISITEDGVILTTRAEGLKLHCPPGDMTAALGQLILAGSETHLQQLLISMIAALTTRGAPPVFFDIGANIGWYSLLLARRFPGLPILAFEPIPAAYEQLRLNMDLNQCPGIQTYNLGLGDRNGRAVFYMSPSLLAASSLADTYPAEDKIQVEAEIRRLDDFCEEQKTGPDIIKCDVEGAERLVFQGARRILESRRPIVVAELLRKWTRCFGYHPNDVIHLFAGHGYSCFVAADGCLAPFGEVTESTKETNYIFLHDEKHRALRADLQAQPHPPGSE